KRSADSAAGVQEGEGLTHGGEEIQQADIQRAAGEEAGHPGGVQHAELSAGGDPGYAEVEDSRPCLGIVAGNVEGSRSKGCIESRNGCGRNDGSSHHDVAGDGPAVAEQDATIEVGLAPGGG